MDWDPKDYYRSERGIRKNAKERIKNAVWALFGDDAVNKPEDQLYALASELNCLMVESFDDAKLGLDDFEEIAQKIVKSTKA